jgi:hypothetical protein
MIEKLFLSQTGFWAVPVTVFFICYLLLNSKKKGMRVWIIAMIAFVVFNLLHYAYSRTHKSWRDLGEAILFFALYYSQLLFFLIFSFFWWAIMEDKEKVPFDFTDKNAIPFKKTEDKEE